MSPSGTIFTGNGALIRHGTQDYEDFLVFVKKYFSFVVRTNMEVVVWGPGNGALPLLALAALLE